MATIEIFVPKEDKSLVNPWTNRPVPPEGVLINDKNRIYFIRRERDGGGEIFIKTPQDVKTNKDQLEKLVQEKKKTKISTANKDASTVADENAIDNDVRG